MQVGECSLRFTLGQEGQLSHWVCVYVKEQKRYREVIEMSPHHEKVGFLFNFSFLNRIIFFSPQSSGQVFKLRNCFLKLDLPKKKKLFAKLTQFH